jgi:oxygen-independent coproporphyrinogen-3 oxidase
VIERLMCDLTFKRSDVARRFGPVAQAVIADAALLAQADSDGLVRASDDGFAITERGRPFARAIAAHFDAYLAGTQARHSSAV